MALRLVLAPLAEGDLDAIAEFIARESPGGAVKTLLRIRAGMTTLLDQPRLGQLVHKPPRTRLRKWTVAPYIVFYRVMDDDLEVVRVLHAARDLDDLLDGLD